MAAHGILRDLIDGLGVRGVEPLSGGDIARAYRLDCADGPLFCKTHPQPKPHMFEREAAGLRALRAAAPDDVGVPEVVRSTTDGLVLEWVDEARVAATHRTDEAFGRGLAALHGTQRAASGGLDGDASGYIGSVPVDLTPTTSWATFYLDRRLRPLVGQAVAANAIDPQAAALLEALAPRAVELCGPGTDGAVPASLLHGDLWGGNRLIDIGGRNWLIDPAVHWGHREVDLAMMRLFGGFGEPCFAAYHEAFPLDEGWRERIEWYQLTPLLVHAILFGGSYGSAALRVLRRYA